MSEPVAILTVHKRKPQLNMIADAELPVDGEYELVIKQEKALIDEPFVWPPLQWKPSPIIISMVVLKDVLYVATTEGVYAKDGNGQFHKLAIES